MPQLAYPVATIGTAGVVAGALLLRFIAGLVIRARTEDEREKMRRRSAWDTILLVVVILAVAGLWARLLQNKGNFFGLVGAGLAVALREPLLSIAGRVAILLGGMYRIGDRIEINKMTGDVIGIGFFYTRMMELGNWIGGDQFSGRIVQFANAQIFGTPVFNYTRGLSYVWDEVTIPVAYESDEDEAVRILQEAGEAHTREIREDAERQLLRLKKTYYIPSYELKPQVYATVTPNYLELKLRYVVDPHRRRQTAAALYWDIYRRFKACDRVAVGTDTQEVTVVPKDGQALAPESLARQRDQRPGEGGRA